MRIPFVGLCLALAGVSMSLVENAPAAEESPPACSAPAYSQFDFWVGSWKVVDRGTGKAEGDNRIEKILNGCAILESWTGVEGSRGHSLTFYDAARDRWHQTWIDDSGEPLYLDGGVVDGTMTLEGNVPGEKGGPEVRHRIKWMLLGEGRIRQHWQSSKDGGKSWSDVFDSFYSPAR